VSLRVGLESLAWVCHLDYGSLKIGVNFHTHCSNYGYSQSGSFIKMWPGNVNAENICGQLHGSIALATSPGNLQARNTNTTLLLSKFFPLSQSIGQPFQNSAVDVSTGMHITKADNGPARLGSWMAQPW